jgi:hypothetical protein
METLKEINAKLLKETIESNLVLKKLNEALDSRTLHILADQLEKLNSLVKNTMPSFHSLGLAVAEAEKDANLAVSNPKKARDVIGKVISFYSKLWNFLANDLIAISRLPAMRDFFDDKKTPNKEATLNDSPDVETIKNQLIEALKSDNSPWFKKALAMITKDPSYLNSIPYLDMNRFVIEFTSMSKKQLKETLEKINSQIKQVANPEKISNEIASNKSGEGSSSSNQNLKSTFDKAREELNNIYKHYGSILGDKLESGNAQELLKQLIVNAFMHNQTPEQLEAKVKSTFKI